MINLREYLENELKGVADMVLCNPEEPDKMKRCYAIQKCQFDINTGQPLPDHILGLTRKEVEEEKIMLEAKINDVNLVIKRMEVF